MVVNNYLEKEGLYPGLEYQLIKDEKQADALPGKDGNRRMAMFYDIYPVAGKFKINPPGNWYKVKIIVYGNHTEYWLNGRKAVDYNLDYDSQKEMVRRSKYKELENFGEQ